MLPISSTFVRQWSNPDTSLLYIYSLLLANKAINFPIGTMVLILNMVTQIQVRSCEQFDLFKAFD